MTTDPIIPDHIQAAINAGHVGQVTIYCDRCLTEVTGDYTGETSEVRFAAARRYLAEQGWDITDDHDHCPQCKGTPAVDATSAPYDAGDAPTDAAYRHTATTPDRNNTPAVDHTGHDPSLCEHAAANPRLDTEAATATQERDDALDDLRQTRAEIANLRAQLDAVNAGRRRLQDELEEARHLADMRAKVIATLTDERDALDNRVRLLLVNPDGDRDGQETITVAELRNAINRGTTAAGLGSSRRAQVAPAAVDPSVPPSGWVYLGAVWQLQQHIRYHLSTPDPELLRLSERVDEELARAGAAAVGCGTCWVCRAAALDDPAARVVRTVLDWRATVERDDADAEHVALHALRQAVDELLAGPACVNPARVEQGPELPALKLATGDTVQAEGTATVGENRGCRVAPGMCTVEWHDHPKAAP